MRHGLDNTRSRRPGFTLVEVLVAMAILVILLTLLIAGLNVAATSARASADRQNVRSLGMAVEDFQNSFGFLPPLVHDGAPLTGNPQRPQGESQDGPVVPTQGTDRRRVVVWSESRDIDFFRRRNPQASVPFSDHRYSKFSLAYYLLGALPGDVDGVDGPGFVRPNRDGTFQGVGEAFGSGRERTEPLIGTDRRGVTVDTGHEDALEVAEHQGSSPSAASERDRIALVDRNGRAYRYYRWVQGNPDQGGAIETSADLRIPSVLVDPTLDGAQQGVDLTDGNPALRSARYAIVGAGANGLFGTEDLDVIRQRLNIGADVSEPEARRRAAADNLVEVGQ